MPVIRPMGAEDVDAAFALMVATFDDLSRRHHEDPGPPPDPAVATKRFHHLVGTDPDGAWVAEDESGLAGCAMATLREGIWGLSLLVVRPGAQSSGLGRELLRRAHDYGDGARGRIILSSQDPRAMRAYFRLGLEVHPALYACGEPRGVQVPSGIREGTVEDVPFTERIDRHVRGAAHGSDIEALLDMGQTLLIARDGYAVHGGGEVRLLAARDEDTARSLLRAALAGADGEATVSWLTARQQWAVEVCLEAGLRLRADAGAVFLGGDVGRFSPYLPSGAFL